MNSRRKDLIVTAGLLMATVSPAIAHHGYALYDMTKTVSLTGIVTEFRMVNPHSRIAIEVKNAKGEAESWAIETAATSRGMKANGFTPDTLKPGDKVTIFFNPGKGDIHIGAFQKIELADGRVLPQRQQGQPPGPASAAAQAQPAN